MPLFLRRGVTSSDFATWVGTFFSVAGAGVAIWQAWQATNAAERAQRLRDEIAGRSAHSELSGLDGILAAACRAMDKYGPGRNPNSLRGISPHDDASAVRAFTAALDRHRDMLKKTFGESCDDVRDRLHAFLSDFASATDHSERQSTGCAIYLEMTTFSGNMKRALDLNIFGRD